MTIGKCRLLLGISVVCQVSAYIIRHHYPMAMDAADFLQGMGVTLMAGGMIFITRQARP